jgi:hypothetical protein
VLHLREHLPKRLFVHGFPAVLPGGGRWGSDTDNAGRR